jgi:hypothetical protein
MKLRSGLRVLCARLHLQQKLLLVYTPASFAASMLLQHQSAGNPVEIPRKYPTHPEAGAPFKLRLGGIRAPQAARGVPILPYNSLTTTQTRPTI